ncbi:MAG TPA: hypothetical protein VNU02_13565 [Candidatus Dormibacteraeota bacterium]|nr:hypothetical protein [Candidatus Dormibacteraeota bacterium]
MESSKVKASLGQRWSAARPTKTSVFWFGVAAAVATMIVGFTWGGWVTGGTARRLAEASGEEAVAKRMAPMCVVRFKADPDRSEKLKQLRAVSAWEQGEFVKKQGWATMPGDKEPESRTADECVKLLLLVS